MSATGATAPRLQAVNVFGAHVVRQLALFRSRFTSSAQANTPPPPLFVAMQGPQGSGKTTVSRALIQYLRDAGFTAGALSTDDLYHTHANLVRVAQENPANPLLSGRGQPGTHDIQFGQELLERIHQINSAKREEVIKLPVFDKSLFNGEGDRVAGSDKGPSLASPLDVFILEGWSMGFSPIPDSQVLEKRATSAPDSALQRYSLEALQQINHNLQSYQHWYTHFDLFLQIRPTDLNNVYTWRLQQEHVMKAANGGQGMSDDAVKA